MSVTTEHSMEISGDIGNWRLVIARKSSNRVLIFRWQVKGVPTVVGFYTHQNTLDLVAAINDAIDHTHGEYTMKSLANDSVTRIRQTGWKSLFQVDCDEPKMIFLATHLELIAIRKFALDHLPD